jgi:hypothetical protein
MYSEQFIFSHLQLPLNLVWIKQVEDFLVINLYKAAGKAKVILVELVKYKL